MDLGPPSNDAIGVRKGFDPARPPASGTCWCRSPPAQAATILPKHYDGFVAATNESCKPIRDAAVALDAIKN